MKARTVLTLAIAAVVVAGCAKAATPSGSGSPATGIAHANGSSDLVIQVSTEGGFIAPAATRTQFPQFSLFGDGSVLTGGAAPAIYPGAALPPINRQVVTEAGIQVILQSAIDAGLKDGADLTDIGSVGVADMPTTVFTFNADGVEHTVKVYALGAVSQRPQGMTAEEFQRREALQAFQGRVQTLETWLPPGSIGHSAPFDGAGARLYVSAYGPDPALKEPAMAWPLATPLASFGSASDMGARCGVVSGQDWSATLLPMAQTANELTPWTSGGSSYAISFRPLLPNETSC